MSIVPALFHYHSTNSALHCSCSFLSLLFFLFKSAILFPPLISPLFAVYLRVALRLPIRASQFSPCHPHRAFLHRDLLLISRHHQILFPRGIGLCLSTSYLSVTSSCCLISPGNGLSLSILSLLLTVSAASVLCMSSFQGITPPNVTLRPQMSLPCKSLTNAICC